MHIYVQQIRCYDILQIRSHRRWDTRSLRSVEVCASAAMPYCETLLEFNASCIVLSCAVSAHRWPMLKRCKKSVRPHDQIIKFIRVPEAMSSAPCRRLPKCNTALPTCSQQQALSEENPSS